MYDNDMTFAEMYDFLIDTVGATEGELNMAINILGCNKQALLRALDVLTGYASVDQYIECELEEVEDEEE